MTLPFQDARTLADSARAWALELGKALSVAVVDYGGFVVLIERMDGARPMTPDIALSKAYSAAVMQRPTEMLENWRNADPVFFTQVSVNLPTSGWDVHHPFGGFRDSGPAFKEQGTPGLRFCTRLKTAAVRFAW